jgi:hypothetical protein
MQDSTTRTPLSSAAALRAEHEARLPVAASIVAILLMLAALPPRIQLFPIWTPYAVGIPVLIPLLLVAASRGEVRWIRLERVTTLTFSAVTALATVANLANLVHSMIHRQQQVNGLQLLASSIAVWFTNVIGFSLLYWQVDRGGPLARALGVSRRSDWQFPQEQEEPAPGQAPWRPKFGDYLFLGYCTATAFSPTDALPVTVRAKMLVMTESTISLATIVVVASRAINILGS